jgi:hypothetical protein
VSRLPSPAAFMFFLRYNAIPTKTHPEHEVLGEAFICCWVERKTLDQADRAARRNIKREKWEILERDAAQVVTEADYEEGDDWLELYRQALTDKEVYVFHTSPRFPVLRVVVTVERRAPREVAEAHYFLSGQSLVGEDEDVAVPNFWNAVRRQLALKAAREAIAEAGWKVTRVVSEQPCGQRDLPEEFHGYYDEAEEVGSGLVFVGAHKPGEK